MSWLSFLTGGAGNLVDSIGNAIDKNITSDEERLKLRNELVKAQQDFTLKAMEFDKEQAAITEKDRESARIREVELAKAGKQNYTMSSLVILSLLGMGWVTWFIFTKDIRERDITMMIVGFLIAIVKDIYGYYFGSSRGSAAKDEILSKKA